MLEVKSINLIFTEKDIERINKNKTLENKCLNICSLYYELLTDLMIETIENLGKK